MNGDADVALEIERQPVQITGSYRGLVRFERSAGDEAWEVTHFNAESRAFDGPREIGAASRARAR